MVDNLIQEIEVLLKESFQKELKITLRRPGLFQVQIPYFYPDGDMVDVFLSISDSENILIQDMGMTLMRVSYEFNIDSKTKRKILNEIFSQFQINENGGNLTLEAPRTEFFPYLMQFLQVITKVSDISYLKREIVKSLFYEYFDKYINENFDTFTKIRDYYPGFDKEQQYPTPYAVLKNQSDNPVCFYPIASDDKCNETTITIQHYELHNFRPNTIAVFENQEEIGRKPLARLSNIVGKQFSTLQGNEERIKDFTIRQFLS